MIASLLLQVCSYYINCHHFQHGERELVVAGGDAPGHSNNNLVEIFNFDAMEWREGPALPQPVTQAEVVQVGWLFGTLLPWSSTHGLLLW